MENLEVLEDLENLENPENPEAPSSQRRCAAPKQLHPPFRLLAEARFGLDTGDEEVIVFGEGLARLLVGDGLTHLVAGRSPDDVTFLQFLCAGTDTCQRHGRERISVFFIGQGGVNGYWLGIHCSISTKIRIRCGWSRRKAHFFHAKYPKTSSAGTMGSSAGKYQRRY